jgi:hypothetical protein
MCNYKYQILPIRYLIFTICSFLIIICCEQKDAEVNEQEDPEVIFKIVDGAYGGHFGYQGHNYWCSITIDNNKYEEWPSGGILYQKPYSCLTVGTVSVSNDILTFKRDSFKFKDFPLACEPDMILPGIYKINKVIDNDSIIFSRGVGDNNIIYFLKIHPKTSSTK